MRLRSVAFECLVSSVEAQGYARGYVRDEWEGDDERFGDRGLVVRAGKKEVAVCLGDGSCKERDDGCVCYVEGGEDGEGVGGVFLDARDYATISTASLDWALCEGPTVICRSMTPEAKCCRSCGILWGKVAFFEFDWRLLDGRGLYLGQAHDAALVVCQRRQLRVSFRHGRGALM